MNLIFGVIILAMFILALRVIWATCLQLLAVLKTAMVVIHRYRAQRNARISIPVIMPRISHEVDWEVMSDKLRREIQQRNTGINRETERLEAQLQAKLKTIEIFEADIQIAKLERELIKIKPVAVLPEPEVKKRRRTKKQSEAILVQDIASKVPPQVYQLREALKGSGLSVPVNDSARH
jgi:hypothetical protein